VAAPRKMEGIGVAMAKDYYEYVVYGQKDPKKETGRPIAQFSGASTRFFRVVLPFHYVR
jgi:hypothetical protein